MYHITVSRRKFIKSAAVTATVLSSSPPLGAMAANERIRVGFIATGGRGMGHVRRIINNLKNVEIVAISDVDPIRRQDALKAIPHQAQAFTDFRKILDMKDIDAVFISTPGHWHVIPAIMAMQAGKDVYLEKPAGHTVYEGRALINAAKKYDRIVQIGTQHRSTPHWINAVKRLQDGEIGRITTVNVWNAWNTKEFGGDMGNPPDTDPPPGVDYDMWLGPAPKRPYNPARWHFYFYFHWDYSGGMVSAWGVHLLDVVMWALGYNIKSVAATGGIYVLKDARDTPDTVQAIFDCGNYVMTYSVRHTNGWRPHGKMDHGIEFIGTTGVLQIDRAGFQMYHEKDRNERKPYYSEKVRANGTILHLRNFVDCMRSRKETNADALAGQIGAVPGHLVNISYRVGKSIKWDAKNETIPDNPEAAKLLTKSYRKPWNLPEI